MSKGLKNDIWRTTAFGMVWQQNLAIETLPEEIKGLRANGTSAIQQFYFVSLAIQT
jgi:hypothetical protein